MYGIPLPDFDFDDLAPISFDSSLLNRSPTAGTREMEELWDYFGFVPLVRSPLRCTSNSTVFGVRTPGIDEEYALKISTNKKRIMTEYENSLMLPPSKYCIRCVDVYEYDRHAMLQMELCQKGDITGIQLTEQRIWQLIYDVATVLQLIHGAGFLHLDVSPSNILQTQTEYFKLGDYGTLLPIGEFDVGCEGAGPYASPEALAFPNGAYVGPATDVYSFGVVLLEIASGYYAPRGGDPKYVQLRSGQIKLGSDYYPCTMSDTLIKLINVMIEPDPDNRPTMGQVLLIDQCQQAFRSLENI